MTIEEIRSVVTGPGRYCLTYQHRGACVSQEVIILAVWDAGECEQVHRGQDAAVVATSEAWILLTDIRMVTPCHKKNQNAIDVLPVEPTEPATTAAID